MPESPEVQALVEFLDERIRGRVVAGIEVDEFRIVKTRQRPPVSLVGARIQRLQRFGKYIGFETSAGWLIVSFGRNGWIRWLSADDPAGTDPVPEVAVVTLDDGTAMQVVDLGDFLAVAAWVVDQPEDVAAVAALGPDPIAEDFTADDLERALGRRRKQIKALLQEQTSLAGIGNAYSDEILHRARLSPTVYAVDLDEGERERLFTAIVDVVRGAVADRRGVPPERLKQAKVAAMAVHGRGGETCPVCGATIADRVFSGASAQFCPVCQPPEHSDG